MRFLVLVAVLAIGSYGASLARSAGDPLPSISTAFEKSLARNVGESDVSMDVGQVVGTSDEFVNVAWSIPNDRVGSMLPANWYSTYGIR